MRHHLPVLLLLLFGLAAPLRGADLDTGAIEASTGAKGRWIEAENVYKLTFPREDVKIAVDGNPLPPFMGLTTWASFKRGNEKPAMVMGDVVLLSDEVNPAMSAALENGLDVTALHNHFFFDEPKVFFMHIGGEGTAGELAAGVRKVLDAVKQVRAKSPQPATTFAARPLASSSAIAATPLDGIFDAEGQSKDGMYKIVFGREVSMPCGCTAGKEMGVNTWAAFMGADDHAMVDGDFACLDRELQAVLKTLRSGGINIVAIHNHMTAEEPRIIFLHYQGYGRAADLAKSVKAALDAQKRAREQHKH